MKILLVNYHYFINGGPDRYFFNIYNAIERQAHKIVPFCFNYNETLDTPHRSYFPKPITGLGFSMYDQQKLSNWKKMVALWKMFHNTESDSLFRMVLKKEKPDLVYMIYLSSTLLPNLIQIAKQEFGIPVVYRLSDFHFFCPTYLFCRNGAICTDCVKSLNYCVRHRCVKNSLLGSIARVIQIKYFRCRNNYRFIERYICPSFFMSQFLKNHGFPSNKVIALRTFSRDLSLSVSRFPESSEETILFLGNVTKEKGIEILLDSFTRIKTPLHLHIVGKGSTNYIKFLQSRIPPKKKDYIHFRGFLCGNPLLTAMKDARYLVHPATWYENMPNSIIEMMSIGKPILTTNIGSLPELVEHEGNGLLVPAGDVNALSQAMIKMETTNMIKQYGDRSRMLYEKRHTEEIHLQSLLKIFDTILDGRN